MTMGIDKRSAAGHSLRMKPLHHAALLACLSIAFAPAWAQDGAAPASAQASVRYDIAAGTLDQVLNRLATSAGIWLSFDGALTAGKTSAGLSGSYSVPAALKAVLAGHGLETAPGAGGGYVVRRSAARIPDAMPTTQLGAVTVTARAELSATTEDTGTYTAAATSIMKGAKSLRDIPQSVSVLTRQQMDDQGITRLEQAYTQMAGVRLDGYEDTARVEVRGFEVSTQLDGMPYIGTTFYQLDSALYDRVELLRGPSGVIAGSGEPGGTLNLVRKRPKDKFSLSSNISYESWNNARTELDVTGPLNERGSLRGRAVAVLQDKDQFYDFAHEQRGVLYGILEYDLSPRDTVGLSVVKQNTSDNRFWGLPRYADGSVPARNSFVGTTDVPSKRRATETMFDYRHHFDSGWTGTLTAGFRDLKDTSSGFYGYDAIDAETGLAMGGAQYSTNQEKDHSYDLNFSGPFEWLGRTHQAVIGYNRSVRNYETPTWLTRFFAAADVLNRHDWGGASMAWTARGESAKTRQSGLYGTLNLQVTEPLSLVLGARLTNYAHQSRANYQSNWVDGAQAQREFTPSAGAVYALSKQVSLYGSYAQIFVPQTQQTYQGGALKPRVGEQFELGVKSAFLNDRLTASVAVYQLRDENRAIDDRDPTHSCSSGRCSVGIGKVQSRGWEAEVLGQLTPRLNIAASYTFNRTKYLGEPDSNVTSSNFYSWKTPKHLAKLWAQYKLSGELGIDAANGWTVGGGVIAQSALYADDAYLARPYRQGGYAVVSAKLGYRFNRNTSVNFDIDNLFDRTYLSNMGDDAYYNIYGKPRSWRLMLSHKFD